MKTLSKIKNLGRNFIYKLYFFIFQKQPGEFSKKLIKNLYYAFFGVGGATLLTFIFNTLAVRYLGAEEYGKMNMITSVSSFFVILPLFGMNIAALRYLAAERQNWKAVLNSTFLVVIIFSLLSLPIYFLLRVPIQDLFKISTPFYSLAVIYAFLTVFFQLFQSFFQGLEKFKRLSYLWIISALVFVVSISYYLFLAKNYSFNGLFWSNSFRLIFFIVITLIILKPNIFKAKVDDSKKLVNFGSYAVLSNFIGFFAMANIDNIIINRYLGVVAVGLYSAYYASFSIFSSKVLTTVYEVFLPMFSGYGSIKELFVRFLIFIKKIGAAIFLGNFLLVWLLFKFYGHAFIFDYRLGLLIALSATIWTINPMLTSIVQSLGIKGMKIGMISTIIIATLNVGLDLILIPKWGLFGAVISTILASSCSLLFVGYALLKIIDKHSPSA